MASSRLLGNNELFAREAHVKHDGGLSVTCGLTLVTRQAMDEGKGIGFHGKK